MEGALAFRSWLSKQKPEIGIPRTQHRGADFAAASQRCKGGGQARFLSVSLESIVTSG